MYQNETDIREKLRESVNECAQANAKVGGMACGYYESSQAEQAEKSAVHLAEQLHKAHAASAFFRSHPEFDDFIRLIQNGTIRISF